MDKIEELKVSRRQIGIRFLYTLLFLIALEAIKFVVQITVLLQYIYLLVARKYSIPLRNFSNRLAAYAYRVIRYTTLNENFRSFPFHDFPEEMEDPDERVLFE
jgi:hypothetical protein